MLSLTRYLDDDEAWMRTSDMINLGDIIAPLAPVFSTTPVTQALYQEAGKLEIPGAVATPVTGWQWQKLQPDGTTWANVAGQTSATLTINKATSAGGTYRVLALNGSTSTPSPSVSVVSVYLQIRNDSDQNNSNGVGVTQTSPTQYVHNAVAGLRYFSAYYRLTADDSAFTPDGLTGRAVVTWASSAPLILPVSSVDAKGQLACRTVLGVGTLTATIGNLSSTLTANIGISL